jgi:hypothetical protein
VPPRGLLGARDPLAQRLFQHKKRTRDLRRGEATDETQCERDAGFDREYRMARGEDEPEDVIIDHLVSEMCSKILSFLIASLRG